MMMGKGSSFQRDFPLCSYKLISISWQFSRLTSSVPRVQVWATKLGKIKMWGESSLVLLSHTKTQQSRFKDNSLIS